MPNFSKEVGDAFGNLPGELLLLFTVLIWVVFLLILFSNPHNKLNIWCFIGGMTFSVGALKEFLYYTLGPMLIHDGYWSVAFSQTLYSLLSAVFYYLSMPAVLIFCFYFHRMDVQMPKRFRWFCMASYLPAVLFSIRYPCTQTLFYQSDTGFCLAVALYNWCAGILATIILVHRLRIERLSNRYQQRRLAAVSILVPLWVWLFSAFPYHALGIPYLSKIWKINLLVVLFILIYCLYHAFRDGIWGMRFRRELYDWSSGNKVLQKNTQYIGHALKNDLSKIEWCTKLLEKQGISAQELEIIQRSVSRLKQFINKTQMYSDRIVIVPEYCVVEEIFREIKKEFVAPPSKNVVVYIAVCDKEPLFCDRAHLEEILRNLIANAVDAIADSGEVTLSYQYFAKKKQAVISVSDSGCGIVQEDVKRLFEPYYTTKMTNQNLGLGLYYCWNVVNAHDGSIHVKTEPQHGSTFSLYFPVRTKRRKRRGREDGENPYHDCGG